MIKEILAVLVLSGAVLANGAVGQAAPAPAQTEKSEKSDAKQAAEAKQEGAKPADETKPNPETAPKSAGAVPLVGGSPLDPNVYVIGAQDVLGINVWNQNQLSGQFHVRPDGIISMLLIGEIKAAGLTTEALKNTIAQKLADLLNHPEVTVSVLQVNSKKYYIQGEVNRPGSFPLLVPTTVLEALVNAGGFRDFAKQTKITVMRGAQRFKFNYKDVSRGKNMDQNILLQSGDLIIVP